MDTFAETARNELGLCNVTQGRVTVYPAVEYLGVAKGYRTGRFYCIPEVQIGIGESGKAGLGCWQVAVQQERA